VLETSGYLCLLHFWLYKYFDILYTTLFEYLLDVP